ncbi:hypothetical protein EJ04DRAFT_573622 [Polyplosphaeria fusca]|uniref:Uncharacterized protein n=1 Tax=Polyplosphaeria fusca TaxID=682080 RepID=A0A9P4R3S1_9PLEO|nr:hypothetical protein EJ04DRAFT_573622 [Polyplosphaeria fusca]
MSELHVHATTPRKAKMSAHSSPSRSPSRRVLGDLPTKPVNTPSKQTHRLESSEAMKSYSPIKQVSTLSPQLLLNKENLLGSDAWRAGRKRSIYEVDDAENIEHAKTAGVGRVRAAPGLTRHTMGVALEESANVVPEDDKEPMDLGSPTEPDTPTPEVEDDLPVSQQTSASKDSFSNFLDFEACASQQSVTEQIPHPAPVEEKKSRAELLRLRLGFGYYKVKTAQVDKSSSEILESWTSTSDASLLNSTSTAISSTNSFTAAHAVPSVVVSPPRRDSVSHVVANIDPSSKFPKLIGGPVLLPTAYSSRKIYEYQMPSSPPGSGRMAPTTCSPQQLQSPTRTTANYRTPVLKRMRTAEEEAYSDEEMDMEETVEARLERIKEEKRYRSDVPELTSSVVKKSAAHGLLELMSGRT